MKKSYFLTIPLLLSSLITSCSKSNVPPPTPLNEKPPTDVHIKVKWKRSTGNGDNGLGNYNLAPTYSNDMVFVPNENGMVYALSMKNGKVIWKKNTHTSLSAQPNTIANAIIFGSIKGKLTALDDKTGKTLWLSEAPSSLFAQPTIYSNYIYTHTHDGSVSAFDARDGSKEWSASNNIPELILPGNSSPIVLNDTVMIGSSFGTVLGFTVKSGDKTINIPIAIAHGSSPADKMVDITANPMLYHRYLIFAAFQSAIVALDKDSGKMLWAKKASIITNMAIDNNVIFTTQADSELKAYNIENGETVWTQDTLKWRKITGPVYYKGLIVVADYQGYLHFFSSLNGEYLGRYKLTPTPTLFPSTGISAQLVPTKDGILVEDEDGTTYLVDAYSDKVIYESILGDYEVDKGANVDHIKASIKPAAIAEAIKKAKEEDSKGLKVNVIIGDFSKGKPTDV
ncbi:MULTISPECIES: outer membrane protein assembly factor BamB [unclassified Francisella]|uniref:outer membrane protein assembly factor BamB n=1 Tax=unclassified Francisella TaxID=2610885 RepID=UPI002E31C6B5|nr:MULTISPECIES: outer membrane protein assembly factor BamB [unclassified Francisella]MED7818784.1 outer membrane protein assembly factor BamB [Francisella sp. 19S2-4]MED7829620.1 outer membrane protein assembly factor BamB [Francisella sp. 19S2-10]